MKLGELDIEAAAKAAVGNWQHFDCFCWHRERAIRDADQWTIVYTRNRDSGLLDQSNAVVIEQALERFTKGKNPDVVPEHHSHWACGWIAGFSIRVFRKGYITEAFRAYHELAQRLADYPVLDEEDYSRREYEATVENLADAAWKLKHDYELPEGWESAVYEWLSDNDPSAVEDTDDRGAYPSENQLQAAFDALGYRQMATV